MHTFERQAPRAALALAALLLAPPAQPLLAQAAERGGFVVRLGADTVVVERFVRTGDRLEAWSVNRQPATVRRHFVLTLQRGMPARMEYDGGRVDGSQPPTRLTMTFAADTTTMDVTRNDSTQTFRIAGRELLPAVGSSFALTELAIARFLASRADSATLPTLPVGSGRAQPLTMKRAGAGTVHIDYFGAPWIARVDARGRLVSLDGSRTANKITVERVKDVDVEALTREFARRDTEGRGFGVASRADSVRATLGDANIAIKYARPARRGRQLMGGIIPLDSVWRTGANAATMFTTSMALDIGGATVPAGSYTLWTLPTRTGWQLIVNKQTGQWGTAYDAKQDLVRIPMTVNKAAANGPELFTIAMEPAGAGAGLLRLTWGDVDVSVPVKVQVR